MAVPDVFHISDDLLVMDYVEGDGELGLAAERGVARHLAALPWQPNKVHSQQLRL